MPEPLARLVADTITGSASASAVGWIFAHAGQWGVFLPEGSDDPAWPLGTTYLRAGAPITLPPFTWVFTDRDDASGWVSQDGDLFSRPLLLHPLVTLMSAEASVHPRIDRHRPSGL